MGQFEIEAVPAVRNRPRFATTRWSLIAAAKGRTTPESKHAFATLCQDYWYPVYSFIRQRGNAVEQAEDLTQEFFLRILGGNVIDKVDHKKGSFRSFLLNDLKHFISHKRAAANATKRGGRIAHLTLDFESGEHRYSLEPIDASTPEHAFERRWALELLDNTLAELRKWCESHWKNDHFENFKGCLEGDRTNLYAEIAAELKISKDLVKTRVYRLRQRLAQTLRARIADTLAVPTDAAIEDELTRLFKALSD